MLITFFLMTLALLIGSTLDILFSFTSSDFSLATRWHTAHLFLPNFFPILRQKLSLILFWTGTVLLLSRELIVLLFEHFIPAIPIDELQIFLSAFLCLVFFIQVLCSHFSLQQIAFMSPALALSWIILISTSGNSYVSMIAQPMCLLLFFLNAPLYSVIKVGFTAKAAYTILTIGLYISGQIPDHWNWLEETDRIALGFGHYNILGKVVFELLLLYVCLRFINWHWWDSLVLFTAAAFVWIVPRCRTAFLAITILILLIYAAKYTPYLFRNVCVVHLLSLSWVFSAIFSFLAGWFYGSWPFLEKLNSLLSNRLYLMHQQMQGPSVQLFGAVSNGTLNWNTAWTPAAWIPDLQAGLYNYNFLDNGYAFCLYMAGPFWLIAFCIGYGLLIRKFLKSGYANWPLAFMLIVMALYTVSEREFASFWIVILLGNLFGGNLSLSPRSPVKRPARK